MHRNRVTASTATLALAVVASVSGIGSAGASFPGENGRIVFQRTVIEGDSTTANPGISTIEPDGSSQTDLTTSETQGNPTWSPDGHKIAYVDASDGDSEIWIMNEDGTNPVQLTSDSISSRQPAWSPDGTEIVFQQYDPSTSEVDLFVINTDGTNKRNLTNSPSIAEAFPTWSINNEIAFHADGVGGTDDIFAIGADGSGLRNITNSSTREEFPDWSPDGTKIIYDRMENPSSSERDIWVSNADGTNASNLTNSAGYDSSAAWSPDGTKIVYMSAATYPSQLWTMNADGTDQQQITTLALDAHRPDWQPIQATPDTTDTTSTSVPPTTQPTVTTTRPATAAVVTPRYVG